MAAIKSGWDSLWYWIGCREKLFVIKDCFLNFDQASAKTIKFTGNKLLKTFAIEYENTLAKFLDTYVETERRYWR